MSLAWAAYRVVAPCLGAVVPAARLFASPRERARGGERLGDVRVPGGVHAWIHGASMGEALAVLTLARELGTLQAGARIHVTANTRTGRARLAEAWPSASLAPLDAPQAVRAFFRGVEPQRLFVIETELWPHWLLRARLERVPVAIVSARLSPRSVERYRRLGAGLRELVSGLEAVLCQGAPDRERWLALGARPERVSVIGNLKSDGLPEPALNRPAARLALGLAPDQPVLVLGSLRPGELGIAARAWARLSEEQRAQWQVVAVPRHPHAAAELREEAARAGQALAVDGEAPRGAWRFDDRMGVLGGYYAVADLAVVGGSFAPHGGHNPLEPAACGAAVLIGPHHGAQLEGVRALRARDAVRVVQDEGDLARSLAELIDDEAGRRSLGQRALESVREQRGAARRAVARLVERGLWPAD